MKLNSSGVVQYATFLGAHGATAIAVDSQQQAWIVGAACLPDCGSPPKGTPSTVLKLDANGAKALVDRTFGGGTCCSTPIVLRDAPLGVALDASDSAWIVGKAASDGVPTTPGVQSDNPLSQSGYPIGYILHLSPSGDLLYGSYVGDTLNEQIPSVAIDAQAMCISP
jgi:hypothetical protein